MNSFRGISRTCGLTLIEALVIVTVLFILLLLVLPMVPRRNPPPTIAPCMNNLRQIELAMRVFAEDNGGRFPAQAMATNAAAAEALDRQSPASYFAPLAPEVSTTRLWICPTDTVKVPATSYAQFNNSNVSYFLSVNATGTQAAVILAGDRHLTAEGKPVAAGPFAWTTNLSMGWSRELHPAFKLPRGCLVFADDHAESPGPNLAKVFRAQPFAASKLGIP